MILSKCVFHNTFLAMYSKNKLKLENKKILVFRLIIENITYIKLMLILLQTFFADGSLVSHLCSPLYELYLMTSFISQLQ